MSIVFLVLSVAPVVALVSLSVSGACRCLLCAPVVFLVFAVPVVPLVFVSVSGASDVSGVRKGLWCL